jgi:intein/homing endonuclease
MVRLREVAMRAKDIVNNSFKTDKRNAKSVFPGPIIKTHTGFRMVTVTKIPKQKARQHIVKVDMDPSYTGPFNRCPNVKVDCDCGRFLYTYNYALDKHDAAIKDRTNQDPPSVTNPNEVPGICVDGEAWIYANNGSKRLKNIEVGDEVRTLYGMRRVVEKRDMGVKDVVEVTLESGRRLRVTPDHLVLNADRSLVWRRADSLQEGSWLISSEHTTNNRAWIELNNDIDLATSHRAINPRKIPDILTPDVAEFLGLFVAEGCGHTNGGAKITQYEPITKNRLEKLCRKIWRRRAKDPKNLGRSVSLLLQNWGVDFGSFNKSIPDVVLESSNDILRAFLKGYYAGDGWFSRDGLCSTAGTRSKQLRDDLLYALLRLGVPARSTEGQFGSRPDRAMQMVRTSDRSATFRAFKQFAPDRCSGVLEAEPSTSKYNGGSFGDRIPIEALNGVLKKFAKQWAESHEGTKELVPVSSLAKILFGTNVWNKLKQEGLIVERPRSGQGRLSGSGKMQHFASMHDALAVTADIRAKQFFTRYLVIRRDGNMCHRKHISSMLSKLPARYRDDVALQVQIFLRKDIFFEKVKSVEKVAPIRVYDIGVDKTPHFFANGICVHNCKHGIIVLRALAQANPVWAKKGTSASQAKASRVPLTTLSEMKTRIRQNKV